MVVSLLFFLFLSQSYVGSSINNGEVATFIVNQSSNQVSAFDRGDIVGEYKLEQRLDYLGTATDWRRDDLYGQKLLVAPDAFDSEMNAFEIGQSSTFGYLTLAKEIRMNLNASCVRNGTYCLDQHIFRGGHGEVWRARQILSGGIIDQNNSYILKRMHIKDRPDILKCALREIFFGVQFKDVSNVARYVSYFKTDEDYWLVFKDEGISLQKLLYSVTMSEVSAVIEPSLLWRKLRTTKGASSLRGIMKQIVASVAAIHLSGVTHRDVKPSNILLNTESEARILMADFSSAVSDNAVSQGLYGVFGPSVAEETLQYAPPEVLLSIGRTNEIAYDVRFPHSYDSWSVGVVFLEMIFGTSDVFTVDQRTAAMIAHRMKRSGSGDSKATSDAMLLAALADFCIYSREEPFDTDGEMTKSKNRVKQEIGDGLSYPGISSDLSSPPHSPQSKSQSLDYLVDNSTLDSLSVTTLRPDEVFQRQRPSKRRSHDSTWHQHLHPLARQSRVCGLEDLRQAILRRDPLGTGVTDRWALDLLSRLLRWDPAERISMMDGPHISPVDGSEHATRLEARTHMGHTDPDSDPDRTPLGSALNADRSIEEWNISEAEPIDVILSMTIDTSSGPGSLEDDASPEEDRVQKSRFWATPDVATEMNFTCPKCGRSFSGDWAGCHKHVATRRHGARCVYPAGASQGSVGVLPSCLSEHSMLPLDEHSGWCELQGRRRYMEDMHSVVFGEAYKFFAVFDGHSGSKAARFASKRLHALFDLYLSRDETSASLSTFNWHMQAERLERINTDHGAPMAPLFNVSGSASISPIASGDELLVVQAEDEDSLDRDQEHHVKGTNTSDTAHTDLGPGTTKGINVAHGMSAMREAFLQTNRDLASTMTVTDSSGATASVAVLFEDHLLVANVGDSRVVLCCSTRVLTGSNNTGSGSGSGSSRSGQPVQLTVDHTPYDAEERIAVESRGGFIAGDGVLRVNGKLAVSRSLGDCALADVITAVPDVSVLRLRSPATLLETEASSKIADTTDFSSQNTSSDGSNDAHSHTSHTPSSLMSQHGRSEDPGSNDSNSCSTYQHRIMRGSGRTADDSSPGMQSCLQPLFLILASDGLWDFVTGEEATELVCEFLLTQIVLEPAISLRDMGQSGEYSSNEIREHSSLLQSAMHDAARLLAVEAFVRGSMDNVGVCVVDLLPYTGRA